MSALEQFLKAFANEQMVQVTIEYCAVDNEFTLDYSEFNGVESIIVSAASIEGCIENLKMEINVLDLLGVK